MGAGTAGNYGHLVGEHLREDLLLLRGQGDGQHFEHFLGNQPAVRRRVGQGNGLHGRDAAGNHGFGLVEQPWKDQGRVRAMRFIRHHQLTRLNQVIQGG